MEMKERDERGRVAAKKKERRRRTKKHSRKDIASYASWERGATLEISEYRHANWARKKISMEAREGKILSRGEKSNPLQCISGQRLKGVGVLACGERKSRFEKMKFVPRRIPVSIFTVCMCWHVRTSRTRFPRFRVVGLFLSRASRHARYFSLPINHAARMAKTNLNSAIERA